MATAGKDIQQTVVTNLQTNGAEALQRQLDAIVTKLEAIGKSDKKTSPALRALFEQVAQLNNAIAQNDFKSDQWAGSLGKVSSILKTISTVDKAVKLFEKGELENITAQLKQQAQIQKEQVVSAKEQKAQLDAMYASRDRYNNKIDQARVSQARSSAPDADTLLGKRANANYLDRDGWKSFSQNLKNQMRDAQVQVETQAKELTTRNAQKAVENSKIGGGLDDLLGLKFKGTKEDQDRRTASSKAFWREQVRIEREATEETERYRKLREDSAKNEAKSNAPTGLERGIQNRAQMSVGTGAASLLLIQGALAANSALLYGTINGLKESLQFITELEASFRNVQAVIGATSTEMKGLEGTIKDISMGTKFSALEVSEAALALGQAGLSTKQITDSLQPVITLANASGSSVAQAVDLVTSVVGVFDKNAGDVADIANKITQAANGSRVSVDKLSLGFQYAGNTASQLGISFEEVTAAMAAMSNAGIKSGSTMGTGLRQFLVEVQKPSENFLTVLQRLGLSISDLDFRSKGFIGVIKTLKEAGFVASDAIQSFDVRGAAAFNALLARPDDLQNQYDSLSGSSAAMKANEIQMNSLSAQSSRLTNTLGAMASTGFEPVLQSLTALIRLLADGLSGLSEFSGTLKVLGTVLAGLAGGVAAAWIVPLVSGLGTVVGILARVAGTAPLATAGITSLGTAMTALNVAFGTTALVAGGVAAAIVAGIAIFTLADYAYTSTAEKIEGLETAMAKTKGAAQEKSEAIIALTNKLELLQYREKDLTTDQDALKTQVSETNDITARWGMTNDVASTSLETLRGKIRQVRSELEQMRFADLSQIANEASSIYQARKDDVQQKITAFRASQSTSFSGDGPLFTGQDKFLAQFKTDDPRGKAFADTIKKLQSGEGFKPENAASNSALEQALRSFAADRGEKGPNFFERRNLNPLLDRLGAVNRSTSDMRQADLVSRKAEEDKRLDAQRTEFNDRLRANGIDLERDMGRGNLAARAKESLDPADRNNPIKLNEATRKLTAETEKQLAATRDAALGVAQNSEEKKIVEQKYRTSVEEMSKSYLDTAAGAKTQMGIDKRNSPDDEELSKLKKRVQTGISASDAARVKQLIQSKYDKEFEEQNVGRKEGPERASYKAASDRSAKEAIEAFEDSVDKAAAAAGAKALKSQESSYKALIEAKMREAKSFRGRAGPNTPLDDLTELMDQGLDKIAEAKKMELGSIARQYSPNSIEYKNLIAAAEEKYSAASQTFIGSFNTLFEAVTRRSYNITDSIKELTAKIKQWENEAQERVYKSREALRGNDLENARNTGPVSGRNRSDVDTYLTNRAREPMDLAATRFDLQSNAEETTNISGGMAKLQIQLTQARVKMEELSQKKKDFLEGKDIANLNENDARIFGPMAAELKVLNEEVTKGDDKMEGFTNKMQALRAARDQLVNKEAGLTPGRDPEDSWDNLTASLEKTWKAYNDLVSTQSTFKTMEGGMFSAFQGVGQQFSTFFSSVFSGTQKVGTAFRTMAVNIIKSMMDVLAQALAMRAVRSILQAFAPTANVITPEVQDAAGVAGVSLLAEGGPITGGIPGKDSVPVAAMPGEFMVKKSAVDALGMNFMKDLNNTTASTVSAAATPAVGTALAKMGSSGGGYVNVWVVSPDQADVQTGPNDIVAVISDDISRGGQIKKLIKSVQMGA